MALAALSGKFNYKKIGLFCVCFIPAGWMIYRLFTNQLGAEPVDKMLEITGQWTLRFLLITLAITTIRKLFKINWLKYRRMLGLYAFFYAFLHFLTYFVFDQNGNVVAVFREAIEKKYLFVGMLAFILLIVLAITSPKKMLKRLGKKWVALHKSIYLVVVLGLIHFAWLVKSDYSEIIIYAVLFIVVLALRKLNFRKS